MAAFCTQTVIMAGGGDGTQERRRPSCADTGGSTVVRAEVLKMFPTHRPRRLRATPAMRRLVAETDLRPRQLVLPLFVREGIDEPVPVTSMPGVVQHTRETLRKAATEAVAAGVGGLMLFGVPARRDAGGARASTRTACSTWRCATSAPRSATPPSSWRTRASTSSPTTATAACSTSAAASTTTPPSPSTPRWPWPRRRRAPTCSGPAA